MGMHILEITAIILIIEDRFKEKIKIGRGLGKASSCHYLAMVKGGGARGKGGGTWPLPPPPEFPTPKKCLFNTKCSFLSKSCPF